MTKFRKKPVVIEAVQFVDTDESILKLSELGLDPVRIDYADLDNPILKIDMRKLARLNYE